MSVFMGSVETAMRDRPYWCFVSRIMASGGRLNDLKNTIASMQTAGHNIVLAQKGLFGMRLEGPDKIEWETLFLACNARGPDYFVCSESHAARLMFLLQHKEWVTRIGCRWKVES